MKKILLLTFAALVLLPAFAGSHEQGQEKRYALYGVAFYNLENLFDTIHTVGRNDWEYLPEGQNKWGTMKYTNKLRNMAKVLAELCTDKLPHGAAIIGVSEVETAGALADLVAQPALAQRGYQFIHVDGPDRRGVDCGLLYNPRFFQVTDHMLVPYYYKDDAQPDVDLGFHVEGTKVVPEPYERGQLRGDTTHITRGFLVVSGLLAGEKVHVIVNHWPSRAAGSEARERAGYQVYHLKEALLRQDPGSKVIIMGDMNDDPNNKSMTEGLQCKHKLKDVRSEHDLYNPWWDTLYKVGQGSLLYDGKWNLFDQIVLSGNLISQDRSNLAFYRHEVFVRDYLFQQEGKYRGNPKRTHAGGVWLNGYSDHLPTIVYLVKELK